MKTPTLVPSVDVNGNSNRGVDFTCWPVKPLEIGNGIKGGFLYTSFPYQIGSPVYANDIYYWEINTFHSITMKIPPYHLSLDSEKFVSPDGKMIALISENRLLIISQNSTRSFPLPMENLKIKTILPNAKILLDLKFDLNEYFQEGKGFTEIYFLVDPMSGEIEKHTVFLPNFVPPDSNRRPVWTVQYSPNMKYILYRSSPEETDVQYTLFDIEKKQVLWVGPDHPQNLVNLTMPAWEPDSSRLTTIYQDNNGKRNYYSIELDGKITPLYTFDEVDLYGPTRSSIWWNRDLAEFPNWSRNGNYLASSENLLKSKMTNINGTIFIWYAKEKKLYKPCLPGEEKRIFSDQYIDWSFDGIHVLTTVTFLQSQNLVKVLPELSIPDYLSKSYILDLKNRVIYEMPSLKNKNAFIQNAGSYTILLGWVNWETP